MIARDTSVRPGTSDAYRDGRDGEGLVVGNTVRTSDTGFAELAYFDGSFTRVDRSAEYTLTLLSDAEGARIVEAELLSGRSWNRVQRTIGPEDRFEVDTPVATAAVRGTAFLIDWTPHGSVRVHRGAPRVSSYTPRARALRRLPSRPR